MASRLSSVFSIFGGGQSAPITAPVAPSAAPAATKANGKRAPLENVANRAATKKLVVEKPTADGGVTAVAVPKYAPGQQEAASAPVMAGMPPGYPQVPAAHFAQAAPIAQAAPLPLPANVTDIDTPDADAPEFAVEYVSEIYQYMRAKEVAYHVGSGYLVANPFSGEIRADILEWLMQVHTKYQLAQETIYIAVHLLDRFVSVAAVPQAKYQLVGIGALLVASKYEDTFAPRLSKLVSVAENAYTKEEIVLMEAEILRTLGFDLGCPVALQFLRRGSRAAFSDCYLHGMSKYLLELVLPHASILPFLPSLQAAAAVFISRQIFLLADPWNETIAFYTGYSEGDIAACVEAMRAIVKQSMTAPRQVVQKKWNHSRYFHLSACDEIIAFIHTL